MKTSTIFNLSGVLVLALLISVVDGNAETAHSAVSTSETIERSIAAPHGLSAERKLVSFRTNSPALREVTLFESSEGESTLVVNSSLSGSASVFTIPDPARIVIDFPFNGTSYSHIIPRPRRLEAPSDSQSEALRIAAHKDKFRVVLDLRTTNIPLYQFATEGNTLSVLVAGNRSKEIVAAPIPQESETTLDVASRRQPSVFKAVGLEAVKHSDPKSFAVQARRINVPQPPQPQNSLEMTTIPESTENGPTALELAPSPSTTSLASSAPPMVAVPGITTHALKAIQFLSADSSLETPQPSRVKLVTTFRPQYRLARKDSKTYQLRIPNCSIDDSSLTLPFFPPHDLSGFTMIKAQQDGKDLSVTVATDRGTRINVIPGDREILLVAQP